MDSMQDFKSVRFFCNPNPSKAQQSEFLWQWNKFMKILTHRTREVVGYFFV